mmetsp:Transcript_28925/g.52406  ORF Transcript_28925/g.52406 Transcript_28925/m.52406 type:complete len:97 (+) Transcript_28925:52-342(+)
MPGTSDLPGASVTLQCQANCKHMAPNSRYKAEDDYVPEGTSSLLACLMDPSKHNIAPRAVQRMPGMLEKGDAGGSNTSKKTSLSKAICEAVLRQPA